MGGLEAEAFVLVAPLPERDDVDVFVSSYHPRGTSTCDLTQVQLPDRGGFK